MMSSLFLVCFALLACVHPSFCFVSNTRNTASLKRALEMSSTNAETATTATNRVDVVVFGVGDLRTDDHGGLLEAMRNKNKNTNDAAVVPVVVLDQVSLQCIPGITTNAVDTATLLVEAIRDLESSLREKYQLPLQVLSSYQDVEQLLVSNSEVHVHVCDLGPADNAMGYGPYSYFHQNEKNYKVHSWNCRLRDEPWQQLEHLSDQHPEYAAVFTDRTTPQLPLQVPAAKENNNSEMPVSSVVPSVEEIVQKLKSTNHDDMRNTGLYGTHWGGLDASTVRESSVLQILKAYTEKCQEVDEAWVAHPNCPKPERNANSLEHAALQWMKFDESSKNLIAGERMTRFLAAPLFLGTVSPRRVWHASSQQNTPFSTFPLRSLVESREWHTLLAARNIEVDPLYQGNGGSLQYKYWRWHGFLCRYAEYTNNDNTAASSKQDPLLLLIHGFGASGSQWSKTMKELQQGSLGSNSIMAPDLIGFGHSEKPPLTYTQYLWESYSADFVKEIGKDWERFVVGGNSIGGYTSMGVAADDAVVSGLSASGAPGSNKCTGVVLMNSAGQIKTRETIEQAMSSNGEQAYTTIAQVTSQNALPACNPLPRPAARAFGNGLLWYLRPRIQSICKNLYPTNPSAVDDELCQGILRDSLDPGAINVMISGSKLPPPRTANELLGADYGSASNRDNEGKYKGPVLVAQGMLDPLNDAKSRAAMLKELRTGISVIPINAGHCPHDELPGDVAKAIAQWMQATQTTSKMNVDAMASKA